MKTPKLKQIDLNKCFQSDGCSRSDHPDIREDGEYLACLDDGWYAGQFSRQWYGWNFDNWGTSGIQLNAPGENSGLWLGLWEIVK